MPIKSRENALGAWSFLIGVVLAIVIGLVSSTFLKRTFPELTSIDSTIYSIIYGVLVLLGLIVGYMNVGGKDSQTFMIAGAVLVVVSNFGMQGASSSIIGIGVGDVVKSVFGALIALFAPATIIVALKTVFSIANVRL